MDCENVNLPAVTADFCAPNLNFGQVNKIYLGYEGQPFVDWSDLDEWVLRLDNATLADETLVRSLHVVGDKPAAEKTKIEFSQGRSTYTTPKHLINVKVDETDALNYALIQWLEANQGQVIRVWYQAGKYLYGGAAGVPATFVLNDVIPESDEELNIFQGVISWEDLHPARITNPMA